MSVTSLAFLDAGSVFPGPPPVSQPPVSQRPVSQPPVSPADAVQVWIDFDGTITRKDVLDELIATFAVDEHWKAVEAQWQAGEIGSFDCLRQEFDVLRVDPEQLADFLQTIPIDPGAAALFDTLRQCGVPVAVLSDGVESFIRPILGKIGVNDVTIRANRIERTGDRLTLVCPHRVAECRSRAAHCKCASAAALGTPGRQTVYVGDGRSDLCPAREADVVFAKGALARILAGEGRAFVPFETLHDVERVLSGAWSGRTAAV